MTLAFAIIADDLNGALDTATPFVEAGLEVAVVLTPAGIEEAIATGAAVVSVNTASRALAADEAAAGSRRLRRALWPPPSPPSCSRRWIRG